MGSEIAKFAQNPGRMSLGQMRLHPLFSAVKFMNVLTDVEEEDHIRIENRKLSKTDMRDYDFVLFFCRDVGHLSLVKRTMDKKSLKNILIYNARSALKNKRL